MSTRSEEQTVAQWPHKPTYAGSSPVSAMEQYLSAKADIVIKDVTQPGALSAAKVLETIGQHDARGGFNGIPQA